MARSLCSLLIYVNHALVANLNVTNMSFNTIRENKILAKITQFTVGLLVSLGLLGLHTIHFYDCMGQHTSWYLSLLKKTHTRVSSWVIGLQFGLSLNLHLYFVYCK